MEKRNYAALIEERNRTNAFANHIGLSLTDMSEGYAVTEMDTPEMATNPIGYVHGGCLYTAADVAAGSAALSYGSQVVTMSSSFHYLSPGLGTSHIRAEGRVIKHGRRVSVVQVDVLNQDGVQLCTGTFSFMVIDGAAPLPG